MRTTLVSFARGDVYEKSLRQMQNAEGFADRKLLWTEQELRRDPIFQQHVGTFELLERYTRNASHDQRRPYCAAFKPLMLLRALRTTCTGPSDYVLWADSTKYVDLGFRLARMRGNLTHAARLLRGQSVYALVHCGVNCTVPWGRYIQQRHLIAATTAQAFSHMVAPATLFAQRGLLNTHMLWACTPENERLAEAWLQMALQDPYAFCASHTQDQAAFTILAINRSLRMLDPCPKLRPPWLHNVCFDREKDLRFVLGVVSRGSYAMSTLSERSPTIGGALIRQQRAGSAHV